MPATSTSAAGDRGWGCMGTQAQDRAAPHSIVGGCSIAHAWAPCNTIYATPGPQVPGHIHGCCPSQRCPDMDTCLWHHCTHSVTHCGMGRGLSQAHPCTARCAHAESRPLQRQLRQTSSGTQRPRGTHLHKQHSSSFPTARGADKQPRSHPYISSSLPPIAVCAQREWAVRRTPICAWPLPCLDFPEHWLCWGRAE